MRQLLRHQLLDLRRRKRLHQLRRNLRWQVSHPVTLLSSSANFELLLKREQLDMHAMIDIHLSFIVSDVEWMKKQQHDMTKKYSHAKMPEVRQMTFWYLVWYGRHHNHRGLTNTARILVAYSGYHQVLAWSCTSYGYLGSFCTLGFTRKHLVPRTFTRELPILSHHWPCWLKPNQEGTLKEQGRGGAISIQAMVHGCPLDCTFRAGHHGTPLNHCCQEDQWSSLDHG